MAIAEISRFEDLTNWVNSIPKERYRAIYVRSVNDIILQPTVSTRGLTTIVVKNVSKELVEELRKDWRVIMSCEYYSFDEVKVKL